MKIKFDSDDDLPLEKILSLHNKTEVIRSVSKRQQVLSTIFFRWMFVWVIKMLYYNNIDISEIIDINQSSKSKERMICLYWYFLDLNYTYEPYIYNGCHGKSMMAYELKNIAVLNLKGVDYRCISWNMKANDAINMLNDSKLDYKGSLKTWNTNKTPIEVIKERAFGGTYFRDIYSSVNSK